MMPLIELLKQQQQNLDTMMTLLEQELDLLKQRHAIPLAEVAEQKQQLLEQIQALDSSISAHPDVAELNTSLLSQQQQLRETLTHCQEKNDVNGRLIELTLNSNRRLANMLTQIRDKNNITYDSKGHTRPTSSTIGIKA